MMRFMGGLLAGTLVLAFGLGAIGCGRSEPSEDEIKRRVEERRLERQEEFDEYKEYMASKGAGGRAAIGAEAQDDKKENKAK